MVVVPVGVVLGECSALDLDAHASPRDLLSFLPATCSHVAFILLDFNNSRATAHEGCENEQRQHKRKHDGAG